MLGRKKLPHVDSDRNRPQQAVAMLWCLLCIMSTVYFWQSMEPDATRLFTLYFQPVLPPIFMAWLWAHTTRCFEEKQILHELCFSSKDRKLLPSSGELLRLALTATTLVATWAALFAWTSASRLYLLTEYIPMLLYCSLVVLLALPFNVLGRGGRMLFLQSMQRIALPLQAVSWADFLLADMLTSLAKSSGDLAQALCTMATGPSMQNLSAPSYTRPAHSICAPLSRGVMAAVCLPYAIRFIQCMIVWRTVGSGSQVFNALKYCSAFPSLILTMFEHEDHVHHRAFPLFNLWLAAAVFNSVFSYYWDLEMDWDMPWLWAACRKLPQPHHGHGLPVPEPCARGPRKLLRALRRCLPFLRPRILYPAPWYLWACLSNLALRFSWTHRLLGLLEASTAVSISMALLEVFRRYQWSFIRVETELRKQRLLPAPGVCHSDAAGGPSRSVTAPAVRPQQEGTDGAVASGGAHVHLGVGAHFLKHTGSDGALLLNANGADGTGQGQ